MASKVNGLIQKVDPGNSTQYSIASTAYGYCETAAATTAKVVDMTGFTLIEGTTVHIKFKERNNSTNPTLNINGTGAYPIVQYGTTAAGSGDTTSGWNAGAVLTLTFDGTSWVRDQGYNTTLSYGTSASAVSTTASAGTATTVSRSDHVHSIALATGDNDGQVKIAGTNVTVKGLGSNAYSSTAYLPLAGGTMTGGINLVGNQSSAYNTKGLVFTNGSRLGEDTSKNLGIYGGAKVVIRPNSSSSSSVDGIEILGTGLIPTNNNTENLGASDHKWNTVYATTFNGNATSATKATQDGSGNVITDTYVKKAGDTMTGRLTAAKGFVNLLVGTGVAGKDNGSSDTSTRYQPAKWTFDAGVTVADGDIFTVKIPVAGHDYGVYMSVNNGTNYYPIVLNGTGRLTTHYPVSTYITVVYETQGSAASMFPLNGGMSRVTVNNGAFRIINYYDSNSDYGYYGRKIYPNIKAGANKIFPYTLIMENSDGRWESIVTSASTGTDKVKNAHGFLLSQVWAMYANATYNENGNVGTYNIYTNHSGLIDIRYSINVTTSSGLTGYKPVYLVGTIGTDGLFYLSDTWWTQTLPTTDDGKVYVYIGDAYDTYRITLSEVNTAYFYRDSRLQQYASGRGIKNISRSGTTFTVTRDDGSTFTFTQQDNNSVTGVKGNAESSYRTGNVNITPANVLGTGTTAQFWRGDNTWSDTLAGSAGSNTPVLKLTSSAALASGQFTWGVSHLAASMVAGSNTSGIVTGQGASKGNSAYFGFHYEGSDSASNYISMGMYGYNHLVKIYNTGDIDLTGSIRRYYSAASTSPVIAVSSNDKDVTVLSVGHGAAYGPPTSCYYKLMYKGTGSSPNNTLQLIAAKNTTETTAVSMDENGNVTFNGTVIMTKTQDASATVNNSPALIVGGAATSTHLELDANEIMAKTNGTSTAALYLNNDGGQVYINNKYAVTLPTSGQTSGQVVIADGTTGGIKTSGYTIATSVPSGAVFTDQKVTQTNQTASNDYRILLSGTADDTTRTEGANKNTNLRFNPGTQTLSVGGSIDATGNLSITGNTTLSGETAANSITAGQLLVTGNASFTQIPTAPTPEATSNDTSIATTAFVMNAFTANDAMVFKGVVNANGDLPATHKQGWTYKVGTAGTYAGIVCEVGDTIYCITDGTAANNAHWQVVQNNVDGAVYRGANAFVDGKVVVADGTAGKVKMIPNQSINTVYAGPGSGSAGAPSFRALVAADIPTITKSKISDFAHVHGNITNDGKIGSTADYAVYTTTGGLVTAGSFAFSDPTASGSTTSFIDTVSQDSKGKITATKKNLDTSGTWTGNAAKLGTTTVGSAIKPIYLSSGTATECTTYAGGTAVTLNNSSKAGSTASFYAPTAGGTANTQALVGNGATAAPKWVNISPSITITAGTSSAAPKVNVTVLGQSGTAQAITTASTSVYGVTKLNSATNSTSTTEAATPSAVKAAYDLASGHKYWADVEATSAAAYNKAPEMATLKLNGNTSATAVSTSNVSLIFDTTTKALNFVFA